MKTYYIRNIDCESCARKIEQHIKKNTNLETVDINLISGKIMVSDNGVSPQELAALANQVESGIEIYERLEQPSLETKVVDWDLIKMMVAFALLTCGLVLQIQLLYFVGYIIVGYKVIKLAFKNIIHLQFFDEYFLMTLATFAALSIGQYAEALAVMLFYSVGEYIQDKTLDKTKLSITQLAKLGTREAVVVNGDATRKVVVEDLKVGDILRVATGEKIAVDCRLQSDSGYIDTSHLSGESEPQTISKDTLVYGGSINSGNQIDLQVVAIASESMVARLIELVTYADTKKTKTEQFITRFSKIYTPIVVAMAAFIALLFPSILGISQDEAIYRAVTLLVISCPCAFVVSVPLGYVVAIGTLAKQHVLVKGAMAIDRLSKITTIAVDKTGTITTGNFEVVQFENESTYEDSYIQQIIAGAEQHVVHPIARSLFDYCKLAGIGAVTDVVQLQGSGISFTADNKSFELVKAENNEGYTISNLYQDRKLIASFKLADKVKPNITKLISGLEQLRIKVLMLTGDNQSVANNIGIQVGIKASNVHAGLLPEDKLNIVETEIANGETVGFIGDGLNDAAVIKRSDLGIAMGASGSELSIESSDIVISDDNINKVLLAVKVSNKANYIIRQNIVIAFAVKVLFILLGIVGITTMWEAVFSDVGVTLIAIANSMRIKKGKYDR